MIYAYRCNNPACRQHVDSTHRSDALGPCPECPTGILTRRWAVNIHPGMEEHFNASTNTVVSSMSQFRSDLSRAGDEYSERTGIDVNYQPRDWDEMGATDEGMDAVNRERTELHLPTISVPGA